MPIRRPSASVGHSNNAGSARVHKSSDSHHAFVATSSSQQHSLLSLGASATPQQKIVQVLVNRLKHKLPCNSGLSLDRVEADNPTQQAIETLVELSHDSLDMIAWALSELLDRLAKQTDPNSGHFSIEVLQSQLFVLKVLSMTMASRWNRDLRSPSRASDRPSLISPDSPFSNGPTKRYRQAPSDIPSVPAQSELAPLDDSCAKYILSVMVLFLRQTASADVPLMLALRSTDISFRDFESIENINIWMQETADPDFQAPPEAPLRPQPSSVSVRSIQTSIHSTIRIPATNTGYEKTHMSFLKSSLSVNGLIAKFAGRIIFHISVSNWAVVFSRLRTKIRHLGSSPEDNPDTVDLQLMTHGALDRQRLIYLLNELSSLLVNMGREAQLAIAVSLRSAVWNWIDRFPHEFNDAIRSRGRMDGAPERVFDLLYSMTTTGNEKIFWPVLTILNCITSDRIPADLQLSQYGSLQKSRKPELKFTEDVLRYVNSNSKQAEVGLACAVDMCRAAAYVDTKGEVPLRLLAADIAHEIKSALASSAGRKPFWESSEDIDVALYADALVAVFRFLPLEDSVHLFSACVAPERSEAVKICAVRACLTLIQEASRFRFQRSVDSLQESIAPRCRDLLKVQAASSRRPEVDHLGSAKRIANRPKMKRTLPEPLADREVLMLAILSLWRNSPLFFMSGISKPEIDSWMSVAVKLWAAPLDISVKASTASCLRAITELCFLMPSSDPSHSLMVEIIKASLPITLLSVVASLLDTREDVEQQRLWIAISHQILQVYIRRSDFEHVKEIQLDAGRVPAFLLAEIALLVALTSADSGISELATKGLRLLSHADRQPDAPVNENVSEEERSKRNFIYEQLGDPKVVVVGRVGHQKRIRKLLRLISFSSGIHVAVWEECYWRWRALSETIFESLNESPDGGDRPPPAQDLRFQWQNLTLFLAVLGGVCILDKQIISLANVIPPKYLPDKMRVIQNPLPLVEAFISDLINLLVASDMHIRDVARDALGSELSPRLYSKLLRSLDDTIRNIEQGAGSELTDPYILFLDQFIAVLKLLVENTQLPMEDVMSIDISSTMLTLADFISRFEEPASFRIKIKFCVFCESVCDRPDILTLRRDCNARHSILDLVLDWIQPANAMDDNATTLYNELNLACLRIAVKLLDRLELRPLDGSQTGDDSVHVVSRLFNRYAGALLQSLEACQSDGLTSDSTSELGSIHQRIHTSQKEAELRELVITGLTHLVSANSESGFKQCLPLAYDQDNRKRTIFAHVFARVISQGTKFDPEDRSATQARHSRLCDLLRGSDMVLALTVCEICPAAEVDMMISVLLNIFDTRVSLMTLIKRMIEHEVAQTDSEAGLFRSNSTCTRFLSAFARIHGYHYLRNLVQPLLQTMQSMPPGSGYEVDPNKIAPGQDLEQNHKNVEFVATTFLTLIISSQQSLPNMFREICAHIAKTVSQVWPDSKFSAMGAFIFLRFISPAIVSPEIVDVDVPKNDITLRRGLMVVAKIIQNLANNIFFGKEAHMTRLNKFLEVNIAGVTRFLSELNKYTPNSEEEDDHWQGTTSDDTDMIVLHRFFDKHADKIGKELLSLSKPSADGDITAINGKRAWDGLCALLVDLGSPLEVPRPSTTKSSEHREYLDLMARYAHRNTESMKRLFVETDIPSGQRAVFVLRLSNIDVEALDIELLMYYIFKTLDLDMYAGRHFDVVLDCTSFSSISEVPLQWLKYCAELIPSNIRARFQTTHILNPNTLMQKYMRRLYNVSAGTPFCNDIRAYTSIYQLVEHVPELALQALLNPVALEHEPCEKFSDVTMKVSHMRLPVVLDVGSSHLRVTSIKTVPISPGLASKSTEVIPLSDVSDVYNISTGFEPNEFIIRRRQGVTVYFASVSRDIIVKTIRSAKARLKEAQAPLTERFSRFSNVPATLLHVGLLSVDLDDEDLRGAAYDLLGAVCTYLKYDKTPIVACKAGFVPGDPISFVFQLSDKLAEFAPQLTLDFVHEVSAAMTGMDRSAMAQRISCLQYMSPWIRNLAHFANATSPLFERSGARLRDCIRTLSDLSVSFPEIMSTIQKHIWGEVARLESPLVDIILDELVRTATDGGIGTRRCETICHIVAALSSINVRGRIYSKLRKALSKVPPKVSNSLAEHPNWNEISTLIRLALVVGSQSKQSGQNQLYVPEIVHLVTLVAGEGPSLVRKSVYGIVINLLQCLYISRPDDVPGPELLQFINDCTLWSTLQLFGLRRETPTSEYIKWDPANDKEALDNQEQLTQLLVRILEMTAGSRGLLNVWRARWMSLVTATAFQLSPAVQTRSFIALGTLATSEVDDDFVYQILVALRTALSKANETHTMSIVSMLRCLCKIVPAIQENSRYIPSLFWLATALLQSSHLAFYIEATALLRVTLEHMEEQGMFKNSSVSAVLLENRSGLEDVTGQLDEMLRLSFDTSFSFSLASIIFKGMRHSGLKDSAEAALRSLLCVTARAHESNIDVPNGFKENPCTEILGYFLALIPVSTTQASYRQLLKECIIDDAWLPEAGLADEDDDKQTPQVTPAFLGINDSNTALLAASFVGTILTTAQGDDTETEILYGFLSELANTNPEIVTMTYESLQDRIKDTFANSSNAPIIRSVSNIFRVALQDSSRTPNPRGSTSTLGTIEENGAGPGRTHLNALDELGMQGLANSFQFLPPNRGHATKMINWIPGLVALMIA